ncbi:MAG: hypothetical protein AAB368_03435 [bacterium]
MSIVTVAQVQAAVQTDLDSASIQRLLDDAEAEIAARFGSASSRTEDFHIPAPRRRIWLSQEAASVTSVKEGATRNNLTALTVTTDYLLTEGSRVIERVGTGFQAEVEVVFVPLPAQQTMRNRVAIDLVRLALRQTGVASQRDGDHSESALDDYQGERERILSGLLGGRRALA